MESRNTAGLKNVRQCRPIRGLEKWAKNIKYYLNLLPEPCQLEILLLEPYPLNPEP